jgi:hypothetical protein
MSRSCDNPDCDNTVDSARGSHTRLANGIFCSSRCKGEYLLWALAAAYHKTEIDVMPPLVRTVYAGKHDRQRMTVSLT